MAIARNAGFNEVGHVSTVTLAHRYFEGRGDVLCPLENGEEILVASL